MTNQMAKSDDPPEALSPANHSSSSEGDIKQIGKHLSAILTIAQMLGRQLAQEDFTLLVAANDNHPNSKGGAL